MGAITKRNPLWTPILATVGQLDAWLHFAMIATTAASVARYLSGHGLNDRGPLVLAGATVLLLVYAAPAVWPQLLSLPLSYRWCAALIGAWVALVWLAPSFSWVAVPLAFAALRVLSFRWAAIAIVAMLGTVIVAWSTMQSRLDPTVVVGPLAVASLAIVSYRSLERESTTRRELLEDLQDTQADLAEAQHAAGALFERNRLSREIHDSVAQALSSINLLLQAAEQRWISENTSARDYVSQASLTARDGLEEVRRVVHDLASAELSAENSEQTLADALTRACAQASLNSKVVAGLEIHGDPTPLAPATATALIRTARGALANVTEHSGATKATVSLTFQPDSVVLDVRDNGIGFNPNKVRPVNGRGRGLSGMAHRAKLFGGHLTVESNSGEGTALAVSIPLESEQ